MPVEKDVQIAEPKGKLGVLLVGWAREHHFHCGVEAIKTGIADRWEVSRKWARSGWGNAPKIAFL